MSNNPNLGQEFVSAIDQFAGGHPLARSDHYDFRANNGRNFTYNDQQRQQYLENPHPHQGEQYEYSHIESNIDNHQYQLQSIQAVPTLPQVQAYQQQNISGYNSLPNQHNFQERLSGSGPSFANHPKGAYDFQFMQSLPPKIDASSNNAVLTPAPSAFHSRNSSTHTAHSEKDSQDPLKPKVATTFWEDENTICYQVSARKVLVSRREDTDFINGTKLLNVIGMSRGKRDGMLKSEKTRSVVKVGLMNLKGVWIPFERAYEIARNEGVDTLLHPLFVKNLKGFYRTGGYKLRSDGSGTSSSPGEIPAGRDHMSTTSIETVADNHTAYPEPVIYKPSSKTVSPAPSNTHAPYTGFSRNDEAFRVDSQVKLERAYYQSRENKR